MKPADPSPTPWDFSTWGFYCDACEKFFELWEEGMVRAEEGNTCSYVHMGPAGWRHLEKLPCGQKARYIGYDHDKLTGPKGEGWFQVE